MNVIDQAFVKAFARRTRSQSAVPTVAAAVAAEPPQPAAADLTVHPQAAESAVMWYDTDAEDYQRREHGHRPAGPLGDTHGLPGPRSRRLAAAQPAPAAAPVAAEASPQVALAPPASIDLSALFHSQLAFAASPELLLAEPAPGPDVTLGAAPVAAAPHAPVPPTAASSDPFSAAWEVDHFEFSQTIMALFSDPALVQSIGHPLDRAVNEGLQTLLITGDRTGVGQTSVATGIAISAAAAGLRVALVDATTAAVGVHRRALADALNLEVQQGWPEALQAGQSVAQAAVYSIEDQLTVIPQATPHRAAEPTTEAFRRLIAPLRQAFDLVVIDGPCCRDPAFKRFTAIDQPVAATPHATPAAGSPDQLPVDAVILVQDVRHADQVLAAQVMRSLRFHGITGLGLVENFT